MKTFEFIKNIENDNMAEQALYKLNPPLDGNDYVVVSGIYASVTGPETYIFPANEKGEVINWGELDGSFRGPINLEEALHNVGYQDYKIKQFKDEMKDIIEGVD